MALGIERQLLSLMVITALLASPMECVNMYPYGSAAGDSIGVKCDDCNAGSLSLTYGFRFFYSTKNTLYINTNGYLTFDGTTTTWSAQQLPMFGMSMIMPFWADADTSVKGQIYYRQTTDATLLSRAASDLSYFGSFAPRWLFIATWQNVPSHGATATSLDNTFQVVLISDASSNTFVMFNYQTLTWNLKALAGYNNGDLTNHYSIPGSLTSCVQNLATSTNVGHTGRYIFQVGSANYNIGFVKPPSGLTSLSKQKRKKRGAENEADAEETV